MLLQKIALLFGVKATVSGSVIVKTKTLATFTNFPNNVRLTVTIDIADD